MLSSSDGSSYLDNIIKLSKKDKFGIIFPKITEFEVYKGRLGTSQDKPRKQDRSDKDKNDNTLSLKNYSDEERESVEQKRTALNDAIKKVEENRINKELERRKMVSRKIFEDMRKISIRLEETADLIELAYRRWLIGYPPATSKTGKQADKLADCLAWELILENCTDDDLIIVSHDDDWIDNTPDSNELHPFLKEEWTNKSGNKKIEFLETIGELLKKYDIEVSKKQIENEKNIPPPFYGNILNIGSVAPVSGASVLSYPLGVGKQRPNYCSNCGYYFGLTLIVTASNTCLNCGYPSS